MPVEQFQVPLWAELSAAGLGGVQGALFAAGYRSRRIDVLGVLVIGLVVALGGSLLRDIVLNQPPVVIWRNPYLLVAGAAAVVGMALQHVLARAGWLITGLDAVVMGIFGAIGASKALALGAGEVGALVVGVIGAIGGGMLRDVILGLPVSFLQVGTLYAVAAGAGVGTLVVATAFGVPVLIAGLVCVGVTTAVRALAVLGGWTFPEQAGVRLPRRRKRTRIRRVTRRRRTTMSTADTFDAYGAYDAAAMPAVVGRYLAAQDDPSHADAVLATFAPDAHVTDEGLDYEGREEVRAWLAKAGSAYTYTTTLTGQRQEGRDRWTVRARLEGDFPGGVADLRYRFTVRDGAIAELVIAP